MSPLTSLKSNFAIAHDFLIQMGGAERVVEVMAKACPEAQIYTSVTTGESLFPVFRTNRVHNSWMQKLPGIEKLHKMLFFLYPFAFKSLKVPENSLVWISSSSFAKCLPKSKGSTFVCYCHTPPRYFWNPDEYLRNEIGNPLLRKFVRKLMPLFRRQDWKQAQKIDYFIANSVNVQQRIKKCYGRESVVICPPVDVDRFTVGSRSEDFHLIVSRLVSYKRIDLAVEAFTKAGRRLVIIGDGPDRPRLEALAGDTVEFLGRAPDDVVTERMATCQGFIFPGLEDFGITPVEAQACGKPIIAFHGGGALETVVDGRTGVFFNEQTPESVMEALARFDAVEWNRETIRANAERFSTARFLKEMSEFLEDIADAEKETSPKETAALSQAATTALP
ncbi:glycosyltransferase [Verrucomicrobiales bacterium BCK34]|nr:glycosyltransferase [Verrucomicrobiales bacterium BCK34]